MCHMCVIYVRHLCISDICVSCGATMCVTRLLVTNVSRLSHICASFACNVYECISALLGAQCSCNQKHYIINDTSYFPVASFLNALLIIETLYRSIKKLNQYDLRL